MPEFELKALLALSLTGCSMSVPKNCHESLELEAPLVPNLGGCSTAAKAGLTNESLELEATLVLNLAGCWTFESRIGHCPASPPDQNPAGAGAGCSTVRVHAWQPSHT